MRDAQEQKRDMQYLLALLQCQCYPFSCKNFLCFSCYPEKNQKDGKDAESFISSAAADEVSEQTEVPESCRRRSCNLLLTHLIHVVFLVLH